MINVDVRPINQATDGGPEGMRATEAFMDERGLLKRARIEDRKGPKATAGKCLLMKNMMNHHVSGS